MEIRYNHFIKDLMKEKEEVRDLEKQHTITDESKEFKKDIVLGFKPLPKREKEPEEEKDFGPEF